MPRKSSIKKLPEEIRYAVDQAVREGRATIDDIVSLINAMGGEASRSAVGRYVKDATEQMQKFREAQEMAKVWIGKLQAEPDGDVGRLLSEMLRTVAFQTIGTMDGSGKKVTMDIMLLAKAIKDLAGADKLSVESAVKIRQEARKQLLEEQKAKLDDLGRSGEVDQEVLSKVIKAAYGL